MIKSDTHSDDELRKIYDLKDIDCCRNVKKCGKGSHYVPKYLIEKGYNVIPVNPTTSEILGRKSYSSISEVPENIDIIDVFRRSEDVPNVIVDAMKKKGIKYIWMQEGIYNEEAESKAKENGFDVIYNRCMMAEHRALFGR